MDSQPSTQTNKPWSRNSLIRLDSTRLVSLEPLFQALTEYTTFEFCERDAVFTNIPLKGWLQIAQILPKWFEPFFLSYVGRILERKYGLEIQELWQTKSNHGIVSTDVRIPYIHTDSSFVNDTFLIWRPKNLYFHRNLTF